MFGTDAAAAGTLIVNLKSSEATSALVPICLNRHKKNQKNGSGQSLQRLHLDSIKFNKTSLFCLHTVWLAARQRANSSGLPAADPQPSERRPPRQAFAAASLADISLRVQRRRLDNGALFAQTEVFKLKGGAAIKEQRRPDRENHLKTSPPSSDPAVSAAVSETLRPDAALRHLVREPPLSSDSRLIACVLCCSACVVDLP